MNELDKRIERALKDISGSVDITSEATVLEDLATTFKGQYRTILIIAWTKLIAVTALWVYAIYEFFFQETMMGMIAYASLAVICTVSMTSISIMLWIILSRNTTIREIKRLELQVALLTNKLEALAPR